jgi:UDP-N-acetylmuramoylalanine--D-glutamate ligase
VSTPHTIIVGLGTTGYSCLRYLAARERVTVVDTRATPPRLDEARRAYPHVEIVTSAGDPALLSQADRIVVSPGVALTHPLLADARTAGVPITSDIGLFCAAVERPVVGITGTNGKSTVTVLAGELLNAAGLRAVVGGNLGEPALDLLAHAADIYVLELSSFQLERLHDEALTIAAVLNVSPDHMDRYASMEAYAAAKQRIFRGARVAIYNRADPRTYPEADVPQQVSVGLDRPDDASWGIAVHAGEPALCQGRCTVLPLSELALQGRHNQFNALAAAALATAAGADPAHFPQVLRTFRGLDHRCQLIADVGGVRYINDSKATNVGAAIAALEGLGDATRRHIRLIAGGDAKGADLTLLRDSVARYVCRLYLLGKDAQALENALGDLVPVTRVASIEAAVCAARKDAGAGDVVLLAPACASLDMFSNFEARGRVFAAAVDRIAQS